MLCEEYKAQYWWASAVLCCGVMFGAVWCCLVLGIITALPLLIAVVVLFDIVCVMWHCCAQVLGCGGYDVPSVGDGKLTTKVRRSCVRACICQHHVANLCNTCMQLFSRSACQGFLVLFESTSDTIVAGMVLSLTYLKCIQLLRPFVAPELNHIKETSLWQVFFVFLIALLIRMGDVDRDFLTVCLLLAFFANFVMLGVLYVARHYCGCLVTVQIEDEGKVSVEERGGGKEVVQGQGFEMNRATVATRRSVVVHSAAADDGGGAGAAVSPLHLHDSDSL
jgi:hypothetical protein